MTLRFLPRDVFAGLLALWSVGVLATPVSFVALGDLPYGRDETAGEKYRALITAINKVPAAFSIHVGDFKSGSTLCSDEEFLRQRKHFNQFRQPVVYTPGDNEWTDCHRPNNGSYDPLERLAKIRSLFYGGAQSLGSNVMSVETQATLQPEFSSYVENQRWIAERILFLTVHIVGSNNNFETRDPKAVTEFFERDRANKAWINASFDYAEKQNLSAVVIAFQADIFESASPETLFPRYSGFRGTVGETILPRAQQFGKPVLLINGDTHQYRFGQAFSGLGGVYLNVYQLVVPGDQDVRAVMVSVDLQDSPPFKMSLITP